MNKKRYKLLSPKLDVVFQKLFGDEGSESITKDFLKSILNEEIEEIDLSKNQILKREHIESKLGILDIIAKVNGKENINIELQVVEKQNERERMLYYWSRLYTNGIKKGQNYKEVPKTIVVLITDFEINGLENLKMHSTWTIMDKETRKVILTEKMELHIIEMSKMKNENGENEKLLDWIEFIQNPESERVRIRMGENRNLKEAKRKLEKMSENERMQRIAELRDKAIRDEKALYSAGLEKGFEKGREKEQIEIVKKLAKRKMTVEDIEEITGLTKDDIKEILK